MKLKMLKKIIKDCTITHPVTEFYA